MVDASQSLSVDGVSLMSLMFATCDKVDVRKNCGRSREEEKKTTEIKPHSMWPKLSFNRMMGTGGYRCVHFAIRRMLRNDAIWCLFQFFSGSNLVLFLHSFFYLRSLAGHKVHRCFVRMSFFVSLLCTQFKQSKWEKTK